MKSRVGTAWFRGSLTSLGHEHRRKTQTPFHAGQLSRTADGLAKKQRLFPEASGESFDMRYSNCPCGTEIGDLFFYVPEISLPLVLRNTRVQEMYRSISTFRRN